MRKYLVVAVVFVAGVLIAAGCEKMQTQQTPESQKNDATAKAGQETPATLPGTVATIAFTSAAGASSFSVEIAETPDELKRGLMNRESIPENGGMWFVFPQMGQEKFWMKDTLIPLDLIYADDNMKVVHIVENTTPQSADLIESPVPFRYVLELRAGSVAKHGIKIGDAAEIRIGPK